MSDVMGNTLPYPHQGSDRETSASETTPGGREPTRWVAVGVNFSPAEATVIKGRLESYGIPAVIQQEAVGVVMGLTVGPLGSARVLVPEPMVKQALAILAETFEIDEDEAGLDEVDLPPAEEL
jgi:hypothetical protein